MDDLKSALFQKFNIPVAEQELLLASGITPDPSKPAVQCCAEVVCYTYTIVYNKDMFRAPHKIHFTWYFKHHFRLITQTLHWFDQSHIKLHLKQSIMYHVSLRE